MNFLFSFVNHLPTSGFDGFSMRAGVLDLLFGVLGSLFEGLFEGLFDSIFLVFQLLIDILI